MLKPSRSYNSDIVIQYFCNQVGEAGGIVAHSTGVFSQGGSLDDPNNSVYYPTLWPSGLPAVGLKILDTVNKDLSESIVKYEKGEHQVGDKTAVAINGEWVTNFVAAGSASGTGTNLPIPAYAGHGGYLYSGTPTNAAASGWPQVGVFTSTVDEEGYVRVRLNLP